jgi:hypothetical protein
MEIKKNKVLAARDPHLIDNMGGYVSRLQPIFTGATPPIFGGKLTQLFTQDFLNA